MSIVQKLSKITAYTAFVFLGSIATIPTAHAASTYLGASSYKSFDDSPFKGGSYSYFYLEDLEDGSLNTPGVTASGGVALQPNTLTDSVDGDDGAIDGSGTNGYSWYSNGNSTFKFTFDASVLGALPTNVGIVWTDVGFVNNSTTIGYDNVNFEAYDALGASLGIFGPTAVGDGDVRGQTAEDRFFGVFNTRGISAIQISTLNSTDWEVDHLQYGRATEPVPEPATMLASLAAGVMGIRLRSQRKKQQLKD